MQDQIEQQEVNTEQPEAQAEQQATPQPEQPASESTPQPEQQPAESDDGEHKQSRLERRFAKLTSERYALQAKVEAYERMLGQQQAQSTPQAAQYGEPQRETFQDDASYYRALARWEVAQELEQRETVQTRQQAETRFNELQKEARKEYADWEDVYEEAQYINATPAVQDAVLYSEVGADLQYYLTKNPQEVERLNTMPPAFLHRQIGRLEARILAEKEARKAQPQPKPQPVPKAPPPIAPVGNRGDVDTDIAKMSDAEFAKMRRQQIAQRYKR